MARCAWAEGSQLYRDYHDGHRAHHHLGRIATFRYTFTKRVIDTIKNGISAERFLSLVDRGAVFI